MNIYRFDSCCFLDIHVLSSWQLAEHTRARHHIEVMLPTDSGLVLCPLVGAEIRSPSPDYHRVLVLLVDQLTPSLLL